MSAKNVKPYWRGKSVIAFDVSTWSTGWAIWENHRLIYGAIQPPKQNAILWERIRYIHREVTDLLFDGSCDWNVFLEETIPVNDARDKKNIRGFRTVGALSEARASVITAIPSVITLENISPSTWKSYFKCVTGNSEADKAAAHKMMCKLWNKDIPITMHGKEKTYDESDAVAVLTYALYSKDYREEI